MCTGFARGLNVTAGGSGRTIMCSLTVGLPSKDSAVKWRGEVVRNLHAHGDFMKYTIEMLDRELYEKAESGDVLTVWALARYVPWAGRIR